MSRGGRWLGAAAALLIGGCGEAEVPREHEVVGGDPARGLRLVNAYGCATCHIVPDIRWPRGTVGPSLEAFGTRNLIAGLVPNQPHWLTLWLQNPPAIAPATGMPPVGLTEAEAHDVAAYLYTLR